LKNNQAGKGDTYRPTDYNKWSKNYDRIFMTRDEKIDALVNDLDTWDNKTLLGYAKENRRMDLDSKSISDNEIDEEYDRFIHDR